MKITSIELLATPDVKVIRFQRFVDHRGYFTESYRIRDIDHGPFVQCNESFSHKGVVRGLHFQWNPFMGKLVRTVQGRMVDLVLDIRKGSPTEGKILAVDMIAYPEMDYSTWIWVPPGFAHGNFFSEPTTIEYLCTGQYSPGCECGISPLSTDLDWSLCDPLLKKEFDDLLSKNPIISEKDRDGITYNEWKSDSRSENFRYGDH